MSNQRRERRFARTRFTYQGYDFTWKDFQIDGVNRMDRTAIAPTANNEVLT